jgi:hypothetical protein
MTVTAEPVQERHEVIDVAFTKGATLGLSFIGSINGHLLTVENGHDRDGVECVRIHTFTDAASADADATVCVSKRDALLLADMLRIAATRHGV